jgi:hypothetical protein
MNMPAQRPITFAVATYRTGEILESNFLASPCLRKPHPHQILVQKDYISAAKAYNDAIDRAVNDLVVFAHQDVIFPDCWLSQLARALDYLEVADPRWGVLGCFGKTRDGRSCGYVYSFGVLGSPLVHPAPVRTLDEIVLILRKPSGLRFDERLPHFHFYGADICLAAAKRGMNSYAIPAFCIHNSQQQLVLPREFYESYRHFKRLWKEHLPVQTTCITVSRFDLAVYIRRLHEAYVRHIVRKQPVKRLRSVQGLLEQLETISQGISYLPGEK